MEAHHDRTPPMTGNQSVAESATGGDRSYLTSPDESVLEKPSPAPASIFSDGAKLDSTEEEDAKKDEVDKKLRTMDSNDPDAEPVYPGPITKVLVGFGLALAVFLVSIRYLQGQADFDKVSLDQTIVATAIPKISDQFRALNDVGWYASAFFLTTYIPPFPNSHNSQLD